MTLQEDHKRREGRAAAARRPVAFADRGRLEIACHHSPPIDYPEEAHETIQVCVPFENALYLVDRRSETGARRQHRFGARDILAIPAGQPHSVCWRRSADIASFHFSEAFLGEAIGLARLRIPDALSTRDNFISAAARELRATVLRGEPCAPAFAEAIGTLVAYRVALAARTSRGLESQRAARPFSAPQRARVEAFINATLDQKIGLADLAAQERLSMWHFMRRFSASYGTSPHEFITRRRLAKAQSLLRDSGLSITEIALEVGLTHSHFSRTFLRSFGVAPSLFRKAVRE